MKVEFTSTLPLSYRDELERIVFFNPHQGQFIDPLMAAVSKYGVPTITKEGNCLRLGVPAFRAIQGLYALDHERHAHGVLIGAAAYVRETDDTMLLLHLAVHQDYTADGPEAEGWLGVRLMAAVRDICRRTRGIAFLRVLYPKPALYQLRLPAAE